jgi:xanthine dehydrogenase/oxidase
MFWKVVAFDSAPLRENPLLPLCRPSHQTSTCQAIINQLHWFAGTQIRNTASIGGNVCTGSPISDLNPIWMAAGAVFTVAGEGTGERQVPASKFFISYR